MPLGIICINETRLDKSIKNLEVGIQGYKLTRCNRNRNGWGVAIYTRNIIPYRPVDGSGLVPKNVEALCIEVRKPNGKRIIISIWHRLLNSNSEIRDCFETLLQNTDKEDKEIMITGDYNIDLLPKGQLENQAKAAQKNPKHLQMSQLINQPTGITESTKTLIDLIICKTDDPKITTANVVGQGISEQITYLSAKKACFPLAS